MTSRQRLRLKLVRQARQWEDRQLGRGGYAPRHVYGRRKRYQQGFEVVLLALLLVALLATGGEMQYK